jgi:F-type H+-transporting ATPase subunit delta
MPNQRLADRYAKSLVDLATEQSVLDAACADMKFIKALGGASSELVSILKSPIFHVDQKNKILRALTDGKVASLTSSFLNLLVKKGREASLFEIADAFIAQYNALKGIHQVTLTTAVAISDDVKNAIEQKVKAAQQFGKIELTTTTDESIIGGFVLEFNNNLVDASVARDLRDIKKQFLSNEFVSKL